MEKPDTQPDTGKNTRHPLALLADYLEVTAEQARLITDSSVPRPPEWLPRMQALEQQQSELHDALQALDPAALRAQAEADKGLREALNRIACAWTITANSLYVNGGTEFDAGKAAGLAQASESLTRTCADLAQAGGEQV